MSNTFTPFDNYLEHCLNLILGCPEAQGHSQGGQGSNNRGCTALSPICHAGDEVCVSFPIESSTSGLIDIPAQIGWDGVLLADRGCVLRLYSGTPCTAAQEVLHYGTGVTGSVSLGINLDRTVQGMGSHRLLS